MDVPVSPSSNGWSLGTLWFNFAVLVPSFCFDKLHLFYPHHWQCPSLLSTKSQIQSPRPSLNSSDSSFCLIVLGFALLSCNDMFAISYAFKRYLLYFNCKLYLLCIGGDLGSLLCIISERNVAYPLFKPLKCASSLQCPLLLIVLLICIVTPWKKHFHLVLFHSSIVSKFSSKLIIHSTSISFL